MAVLVDRQVPSQQTPFMPEQCHDDQIEECPHDPPDGMRIAVAVKLTGDETR